MSAAVFFHTRRAVQQQSFTNQRSASNAFFYQGELVVSVNGETTKVGVNLDDDAIKVGESEAWVNEEALSSLLLGRSTLVQRSRQSVATGRRARLFSKPTLMASKSLCNTSAAKALP